MTKLKKYQEELLNSIDGKIILKIPKDCGKGKISRSYGHFPFVKKITPIEDIKKYFENE